MRPVRYNVAASLDGYIAGPNGEYDWIPEDPAVEFGALFAAVDTVLVGRKSYQAMRAGPSPLTAGMRTWVFSSTLRQEECPEVTVVPGDAAGFVAGLRAEAGGGEIWLFGGGQLFRSLLDAGQVDRVEVTVVPVLLGGGIPLVPPGGRVPLRLLDTHRYPSGMVTLRYTAGQAARIGPRPA